MRQYYIQKYIKVKFKKIIHKTEKATLFEITPKIEIWLPNTWFIRLTKISFTVKEHIMIDIKLKMKEELKALKRLNNG